MTDAAGAALDRAHLDRLAARFGPAFVAQMIGIFLAQGGERMADVERAFAAGDVAAAAAAAHALKSSAGNLGASALMARAQEVEHGGRADGDAASLARTVAALRSDYDEAAAQLTALLSALPAAGGAANR